MQTKTFMAVTQTIKIFSFPELPRSRAPSIGGEIKVNSHFHSSGPPKVYLD